MSSSSDWRVRLPNSGAPNGGGSGRCLEEEESRHPKVSPEYNVLSSAAARYSGLETVPEGCKENAVHRLWWAGWPIHTYLSGGGRGYTEAWGAH